PLPVEEGEPPPLEAGARQPLERLAVRSARRNGGRGRHPGLRELQEDVADGEPVEERVVALVPVAHEAVVAGRLAPLRRAGRLADVLAGVGVEVAEAEGLLRHEGEVFRSVEQPAEYAGPA